MSARVTIGLGTFLGLQGATKLARRNDDVKAFETMRLPSWTVNFAGAWQTASALCILVPVAPLRVLGVMGSAASVGGVAGAGVSVGKENFEEAVRLSMHPFPDEVHKAAGDARYLPLFILALQLLATEVIAAGSGQRPLWMVAGLCGGFAGAHSGWRSVPADVAQQLDFDLPKLLSGDDAPQAEGK
eukprot:TRINITY_DN9845_c0_g1_i1.p3 TRINITY_DN9845_c0_g1~~TRINITY_DN9845_c0_g1_i1.p3  ORF type:complete len:186 (+),score=43.57 TRINITY_DN9845_c0_g1_i1:101-658(+)